MNIPPRARIKMALAGGEPKTEDGISLALAHYLSHYYPAVRFHQDAAGLWHTKAQAGQMKQRNPHRGWPDFQLLIPCPPLGYSGLHIELKRKGESLKLTRDSKVYAVIGYESAKGATHYRDPSKGIYLPCKPRGTGRSKKLMKPVFEPFKRKKGQWSDVHIEEQAAWLEYLSDAGRLAVFGVGLEKTLLIVEGYLRADAGLIKEGLTV
jgi:hypothetical protein